MKVWVAHATIGHDLDDPLPGVMAVGTTKVVAEAALRANLEALAEGFECTYDEFVEEHVEFFETEHLELHEEVKR